MGVETRKQHIAFRRGRMKNRLLRTASLVLATCAVWFITTGHGHTNPAQGSSQGPDARLTQALKPLLGPRDALVVKGPAGRTYVSINGDTPLVPASILKVLTASALLDGLGPGYRFKTDFHIDPDNNLKIKGYGDPLLVSERLAEIAVHLASKLATINHIILDDSYIAQPVVIPGRGRSDEPYDAPNGALCVNFNTVAFRRDQGRWVSDEPQTPLLPSAIPKIRASGLRRGRITLAADSAEALQYTGEMFHHFFTKAGIQIKGDIRYGTVDPDNERLLWRYHSQSDLRQVVAKLLEFSNNFIANQALLVLGAHQDGPPATMEKGIAALRHHFHHELGIASGKVVEASGISRQNRLSANAMANILAYFAPHYQLLRHKGRQFYKTGHLKGVRTRAGYLESARGGRYRFAAIINTPGKSTNIVMRILEDNLE